MPQNRCDRFPGSYLPLSFGWLVMFLLVVPVFETQSSNYQWSRSATTGSVITPSNLRVSLQAYEHAYVEALGLNSFLNAAQAKLKSGDALFQLSEYRQASESYECSAMLAAKVRDRILQATAVSRLARVCSYTGNNRAAQAHLKRASQLVGRLPVSDLKSRDALGEVLSTSGEVNYALGEFETAARQFKQASALLQGNRRELAKVHLFSGYIAGSIGEPENARTEIEKALELSRAVADQQGEALCLTALGLISSLKRDETRAMQLHQVAIDTFVVIGDRHSEAIARNGLAQSYENLADYPSALIHYQKALDLFESIGAVDLQSVTTFHLARTQRLNGNLEQALKTYEHCLRLSRTSGKARTEANALIEIAAIQTTLGRTAESLKIARKLQKYCRSIGDLHGQALILNAVGDSFLQSGNGARALAAYRKALELGDHSGDTGVHLETLFKMARAYRDTGDNQLALASIQRSLVIIENLRTNLERTEFRTSYFAAANKHYELAIDILMRLQRANPSQDFAVQAFMMSERSRARSLVDLISQSKAVHSLPSLAQVQNDLLHHDTMLLEYSLGQERSFLWTITPTSFQTYELPGREVIENATRELYDLVTSRQSTANDDYPAKVANSDSLLAAQSAKVASLILGPVADQLDSKRLLIVADGALQYLPFEVLPVENAKSLLERNEVVRLPSLSTLMAIRSRTRGPISTNKVAAVISDPVFSSSDDRAPHGRFAAESSLEEKQTPARLSYAQSEVGSISSIAPRGTTLVVTGFDANKQQVKRLPLGEYQIVHFGTHAFLNGGSSGMALSLIDDAGHKQDGVMSLADIYALDLNSNLTVLSACQTALGKDVKGEGLIGLTHGFISAGSSSVVASLWKVDDRATAHLMKNFYHFMLDQNMTPSAALRSAKLRMMHDQQWSAPYYWAGLVLQGEYRNPIAVERNSTPGLYAMILMFCVVPTTSLLVN